MIHFAYSTLFSDPIRTLAFAALLLCSMSLWIKKTPWLWGPLMLIALLLGHQASLIEPIGLIPISILLLLYWSLQKAISGPARFLIVCTAFLISAALFLHLLPGFHNWNIMPSQKLSPDAVPYSFWINFDKPFAGFFILAFCLPLIETKKQWKSFAATSFLLSLIGVLILLFLSKALHIVEWNPKMPPILLLWLIENLFFVAVPEEALLRGFLQKELSSWFGSSLAGGALAVAVSSLIFALFHVYWVANLSFLIAVFAAGIIYGAIFQWTGRIESSIACHYLVNALHFIFFTYPALSSLF